jgi:transposase
MLYSGGATRVKKTRVYTEEFKREALELLENSGRSVHALSRELGIPQRTLYDWVEASREKETKPRPGSAEEAEILRLRRELALVTQERDILKKAVAIFSKEPRSGSGSR